MTKPVQAATRAFVRFVAHVTPPCREIARLLSRGMDHPLPWRTRPRVRLHLAVCRWCGRYRQQLRWLRKFSRSLPGREDGRDDTVLPLAARTRIAKTLRQHSDP